VETTLSALPSDLGTDVRRVSPSRRRAFFIQQAPQRMSKEEWQPLKGLVFMTAKGGSCVPPFCIDRKDCTPSAMESGPDMIQHPCDTHRMRPTATIDSNFHSSENLKVH